MSIPWPSIPLLTLTCLLALGLAQWGPAEESAPPASGAAAGRQPGTSLPAARRVVSLNPSLTAILVAIGAEETLVGVDEFSARQEPRAAQLPRVGGLFSPSLEAVVALQPDLVVLVPSVEQRDFRRRLEGLGVRVSVFENIRFAQVLENIERLGALTGRRAAAAERVAAVRGRRAAVSRAAARASGGGTGPRTVVVLQREPLFIVGGDNFIAEMLESVRVTNLGREFSEPYPRVAAEWLLAAAPEVVIDLSPPGEDARGFWERWPGMPAVASGRVHQLDAASVSLPGPHLDRSLELLGRSIYGEAFERALAAELGAGASPGAGLEIAGGASPAR